MAHRQSFALAGRPRFLDNEHMKSRQEMKRKRSPELSQVDPILELLDPTPNIHDLFNEYSVLYFEDKLKDVKLVWSERMISCAGATEAKRNGAIKVTLSSPILRLRPRKDLVETLLHEMIHAYLFVIDDDDDGREHGQSFYYHMHRINKLAGTCITVEHDFDEECEYYEKYRWQCNGPCRRKPPHYGYVERYRDRSPGPKDAWWDKHKSICNGTFIKVYAPKWKKSRSKKTRRR
ncbi:DNA-dependent metalloprotease SPRTN [Anabrus simplex]|uniref:DNA-dependent metalloprotease SPRTN n=1 Tax=Anabrus simplex TaxID=316456 RepID=UPI0034DD17E4